MFGGASCQPPTHRASGESFPFPFRLRFGILTAMLPTRLILVRHGETAWNQQGRYQGHADSALTEAGVEQARALGTRLKRETFAALYSSDLGRARQTAEIIAAATGHEIHIDARLREQCLGVMQGLRREEVKARWPEEYARFRSTDRDYAPPEGESPRQSVERFVAGMSDLTGRHVGTTVAIVTHGGVLGGFLRYVLGLDPERPRRYKRFNGSWNVFTFENGHWYLETWGDISHLTAPRCLDDG
jgi:probable phosphoglycerate mutase